MRDECSGMSFKKSILLPHLIFQNAQNYFRLSTISSIFNPSKGKHFLIYYTPMKASLRSGIWFLILGWCILACRPVEGGGIFSASGERIVLQSTEDLYRFLTYNESRIPLVSAHRGGPRSGYPENALETFEFQASRQPLIIETDVRMTKDSVLVLFHDEQVTRTTNGQGKVSSLTFEELKSLRLKDPDGVLTTFQVPTLQQALRWGAEKVIFTLDVKQGVPYDRVVDMIREQRAEAYSIIITYSADQAAVVHQMAPELMLSVSVRSAGDLLRLNDRNIPDNRLIAFVGTAEVDKGVYELLHGHGIMCILGTMGNLDQQAQKRGKEHYLDLIDRGADVLSTDYPTEVGQVLRKYRQQHQLSSPFIQN
jgi:glycerophosphoryl diester phosphodiesterase